MKHRLENIHDKLHGRVIVIMEEDLVQRRLLELLLSFGNNATLELIVIIVLFHITLTHREEVFLVSIPRSSNWVNFSFLIILSCFTSLPDQEYFRKHPAKTQQPSPLARMDSTVDKLYKRVNGAS